MLSTIMIFCEIPKSRFCLGEGYIPYKIKTKFRKHKGLSSSDSILSSEWDEWQSDIHRICQVSEVSLVESGQTLMGDIPDADQATYFTFLRKRRSNRSPIPAWMCLDETYVVGLN